MKTASIQVTLVDSCGSDLSVVNAARVSFAKESQWANDSDGWIEGKLQGRDVKLINYLASHKHLSPFNHAFLSFRVKAPIFVARQLVKHKFMPWNEVSRRYVNEEPEFYFPDAWRMKAEDKKQGSGDTLDNSGAWQIWTEGVVDGLLLTYTDMITSGMCPEQARMVLPQNTMTEWIWSGTLGAFCDMLRLRLGADTQEETRQVATLISKEVVERFPVSYAALLGEVDAKTN